MGVVEVGDPFDPKRSEVTCHNHPGPPFRELKRLGVKGIHFQRPWFYLSEYGLRLFYLSPPVYLRECVCTGIVLNSVLCGRTSGLCPAYLSCRSSDIIRSTRRLRMDGAGRGGLLVAVEDASRTLNVWNKFSTNVPEDRKFSKGNRHRETHTDPRKVREYRVYP